MKNNAAPHSREQHKIRTSRQLWLRKTYNFKKVYQNWDYVKLSNENITNVKTHRQLQTDPHLNELG